MKTTETDRVGILPVTSFRGVQPTGIAICERGRMCVWFPRRHDGVSCSVTEIFGDGFSERALCAGYEKILRGGNCRSDSFAVYDGCLCFTDSRIPEAEGPDGVSRG